MSLSVHLVASNVGVIYLIQAEAPQVFYHISEDLIVSYVSYVPISGSWLRISSSLEVTHQRSGGTA